MGFNDEVWFVLLSTTSFIWSVCREQGKIFADFGSGIARMLCQVIWLTLFGMFLFSAYRICRFSLKLKQQSALGLNLLTNSMKPVSSSLRILKPCQRIMLGCKARYCVFTSLWNDLYYDTLKSCTDSPWKGWWFYALDQGEPWCMDGRCCFCEQLEIWSWKSELSFCKWIY